MDTGLNSSTENKEPLFSIISAIYNVSPYLREYLDSLEAQMIEHDRLEFILVDDGSTDNSLEIITDWQRRMGDAVTVLSKTNGGQASARNVGLEHASGEWVTFCDPDDYLAPDYFAVLAKAIEDDRNKIASMYATHVITHDEANGVVADRHPLRRRFRDGDRTVDLLRSPDFFHMSGPTAVLRRDKLNELSLRFREELRFSFEDAHLVASYLMRQDRPTIGYVASAKYFYRKRAAADSSVQTASLRPEKYTDVLRFGHLDLLRQARENGPQAPMWLQLMLLYDVLWYFRADRRAGSPTRLLDPEIKEEFNLLVGEIMREISDEAVHSFEVMETDHQLRDALLLGYKHPQSRPTQVVIERVDPDQKLTLLRYHYSGDLPEEDIRLKGLRVRPKWTKSQAVVFFGRVLYHKRYVWISSTATFSVTLDGTPIPLVYRHESRPTYLLRPYKVSKQMLGADLTSPRGKASKFPRGRRAVLKQELDHVVSSVVEPVKRLGAEVSIAVRPEVRRAQAVRRLAARPYIRQRFDQAWILMDSPTRANDNAEHLYRYIHNKQPKTNAWFVLQRNSPDWVRLKREGFRLLEYGSVQWKAALLNAENFISSHVDKYVIQPLDPKLYGRMPWKFTFLQHGVTVHDISAWFNVKNLDLLVTSTRPEYESIAGDGTRYKFSAKETKLTGMPRYDALDAIRKTPKSPTRIVIAPTWRRWLTATSDTNGQWQGAEGFSDTEYAKAWRAFCSSPHLKALASQRGLKVSLLPHPSLESMVGAMQLPDYVEILGWGQGTFNELLASCAAFVTDYSSTAFDAAYAEVPVVYYQFDSELMYSGAHNYERGYFEYQRDGFGPLATELPDAVNALEAVLANDPDNLRFVERRDAAFPKRDGKNSERVYREIRKLHEEVTFKRSIESVIK